MEEQEENRIARLLESTEKDLSESDEVRPFGVFRRALFNESIEEEDEEGEPIDENDDAEDLMGILVPIEDNNVEHEEEANEDFPQYLTDDAAKLENIPIKDRLENDVISTDGKLYYISKDMKMLWDLQPKLQARARNRNILRMRVGNVANTAKHAKTPTEVLELFLSDKMIIDVVENTNIWIHANKEKYVRDRDCKPTTPAEIKAVFGILYMSGALKACHLNLNDLWSKDGLGIEFFPAVMSIKRFKFLLRALRFDDINTRNDRKLVDKLAPIRDLFTEFVENNQKHYVVSEFVTVDEMLEAFRGRVDFRQYIPNKPAKYGIKIYAMVCAKNFYTSNLEIYAGKQPEGPFQINNSPKSVVERLIEPISGSGRNVTIDNFFTSVPLCFDLLNEHRLTIVGTLRKNKSEIPRALLETRGRPVGSSMFAHRDGCTMLSYRGSKKKNVLLLSSMHDDDMIDLNENSPTFGKPEIVLFYNTSKGGVDVVDRYKENYNVARISNRWPMTVFYSLLNIAALNGFIILKENLKQPHMLRRAFLRSLAMDLCKQHMLSRVAVPSTPRITKELIRRLLGPEIPQVRRTPPVADVATGRCFKCDWRKNRPSKTRCSTCKFFICKEHAAPVQCVDCVLGDENMEVDDE